MTLQSIELAVLLLLSIVTGCLGWLVSQLIRQGRDADTARKDEQTRLTETLAALADATKANQEMLTNRLGALEVVQSAAAQTISGAVTELRDARQEAKDSHTDVLGELAGVASASHDGDERLQSAIDGLAASQRENFERDMKPAMAVLTEIATDVRSLKPQPPVRVNTLGNMWVLGNNELPAISVTLERGPRSVSKQQKELPKKTLDQLTNVCQSLFGTTLPQSLPGMMSAAEGIIRTRVVFSHEKMAGLANGTYQHMQTGDGRWLALMCDSKGKIVEIGHLVTGINPASAISLGWQIATVVTAQHHLANISKALDGLKNQLSRIELWLFSEELGSLRANFSYLEQVDHYLEIGAIPPSELSIYLGKIEDIERSSLAAYDAAKIRISAYRIEKTANQGEFQNMLKQFEDDCNIITASLFVRARAGNTRRLLSLDATITEHRMHLIETIRMEIASLAKSFYEQMGQVQPDPAWYSLPAKRQRVVGENDDLRMRGHDSINEQLQLFEIFQIQVGAAQIGRGDFAFECDYDPQKQSVRYAQSISIAANTNVRQSEAIQIGEKGA